MSRAIRGYSVPKSSSTTLTNSNSRHIHTAVRISFITECFIGAYSIAQNIDAFLFFAKSRFLPTLSKQ